jgi:hypothetical protein
MPNFKVTVIIEESLVDFAIELYDEERGIDPKEEPKVSAADKGKIAQALARRVMDSFHEEPQDIILPDDIVEIVESALHP